MAKDTLGQYMNMVGTPRPGSQPVPPLTPAVQPKELEIQPAPALSKPNTPEFQPPPALNQPHQPSSFIQPAPPPGTRVQMMLQPAPPRSVQTVLPFQEAPPLGKLTNDGSEPLQEAPSLSAPQPVTFQPPPVLSGPAPIAPFEPAPPQTPRSEIPFEPAPPLPTPAVIEFQPAPPLPTPAVIPFEPAPPLPTPAAIPFEPAPPLPVPAVIPFEPAPPLSVPSAIAFQPPPGLALPTPVPFQPPPTLSVRTPPADEVSQSPTPIHAPTIYDPVPYDNHRSDVHPGVQRARLPSTVLHSDRVEQASANNEVLINNDPFQIQLFTERLIASVPNSVYIPSLGTVPLTQPDMQAAVDLQLRSFVMAGEQFFTEVEMPALMNAGIDILIEAGVNAASAVIDAFSDPPVPSTNLAPDVSPAGKKPRPPPSISGFDDPIPEPRDSLFSYNVDASTAINNLRMYQSSDSVTDRGRIPGDGSTGNALNENYTAKGRLENLSQLYDNELPIAQGGIGAVPSQPVGGNAEIKPGDTFAQTPAANDIFDENRYHPETSQGPDHLMSDTQIQETDLRYLNDPTKATADTKRAGLKSLWLEKAESITRLENRPNPNVTAVGSDKISAAFNDVSAEIQSANLTEERGFFTSRGSPEYLPTDDETYMPLVFTDLRPMQAGRYRSVYFRPFIKSLSEELSPQWNMTNYFGRVDPIATYQNTNRTINLGFKVVAFSPEDMLTIYQKVGWLTSMVYPEYRGGVYFSGPVIRMRVGDIINAVGRDGNRGVPGVITSLNFNYDEATWELLNGRRLPRSIDVSLGFHILHEYPIGLTQGSGEDKGDKFFGGIRQGGSSQGNQIDSYVNIDRFRAIFGKEYLNDPRMAAENPPNNTPGSDNG